MLNGHAVPTMTANETEVVHVWAIEGESSIPFEDICTMVGHLVARSGGSVVRFSGVDEIPTERQHYFGQVEGKEALANLRREIGVHRSQSVPAQSTSGRVVTVLIGLELLPSALAARGGRPDGPVLKTYNYINRKVTVHASGEQLQLEAALRGET